MLKEPLITFQRDRVQDWRTLAKRLGLSESQIKVTPAGWAERGTAWLEAPIPGGWMSAIRLSVQDGQLVVAELRIFPNELVDRSGGLFPGVWTAELLGSRAIVPTGGLTTRVARQAQFSPTIKKRVRERFDNAARRYPGWSLSRTPLRDLEERPRPERRSGKPDRFYADLAVEYGNLVEARIRHPVAELAHRHEVKPVARMRDMIHEARERGLLTKGTQGRPGGAPTARALSLLGRTGTRRQRKARKR